MANDMNQCNFTGRLGKDPELRFTPDGTAVCNFSLAVGEQWKDKSGQKQEKTEWVPVVMWRQLAEIAGKYLIKGSFVRISGKIQTRSYDDRDGNKRYITEIVADQMQMLGGQPAENRQNKPDMRPDVGSKSGRGYEDPPFNPDDDIPF